MIDLTLERHGDYLWVHSVDPNGVQIGQRVYSGSLILTPGQLLLDWAPRDFAGLALDHLRTLLALEAEVMLLGTGPRQAFLPRDLQIEVYRRGIGFEVMTTDAACRTYNILAAEGRAVVAGLLPMSP